MNRPEFLDLVTSAIHRAGRPEIARADTVFAALDDPSGVRLATADGKEMLFRVIVVAAEQPKIAPRPPIPEGWGLGDR